MLKRRTWNKRSKEIVQTSVGLGIGIDLWWQQNKEKKKSNECRACLRSSRPSSNNQLSTTEAFNPLLYPELSLFDSSEALGFKSNNLALPALICLTCPRPKSTLRALCTPEPTSSFSAL